MNRSSSPLFVPEDTPPRNRRRKDDPGEKVERLVAEASTSPPLSASMNRFLKSYPDFSRLIARQIRMLSQRNSNLSAAEMTIYDKALLRITRNGADVRSAAAILFFCEHWCEYDPVVGAPTEAMHETAKIATLPWDRMFSLKERLKPCPKGHIH
jgi:hypothetical protein